MSTALPNIVLIHSDQHRFDCVGANGHRLLRTPHMDRLAAEGVNFTHAFTPTAICSPERASLLTGLWPTQHGCLSIPGAEIYHPARDAVPLFSKLLRETGYRMGYVGKWHAELPGGPRDWGFEDVVGQGQYGQWRLDQGLPPRPRTNGWFGEADPDIRPEESHLAWEADHAIRMIRAFHDAGSPFLVRWDPVEPHLPNIVPEPYLSMYPPETIPPWPSFPDPLNAKPYIQSQQRRTWKVEGWGWESWAPIVSRYLGEVSLLDAQIGRVLDTLDALGLTQHTLVVYTTDHGDLCGAHGMMDKHFVMYDDVMRVPLMARWPGHLPAGIACDAFVVHALDLATTFCRAARVSPPESFEGRDLVDVALGEDPLPRPDVFGMWHGGQFGSFSQRMVRDRRWKYVWNCTAEDELYDLQADPGERLNLAPDPAFAGELKRLRDRLIEWMGAIKDPMLNAWTRAQLAEGLKR